MAPYARSSLIALPIICIPYAVIACQKFNAQDVSKAIQNSPNASQEAKNSSCTWGGAAVAESGGNTCAQTKSGNAIGALQMTPSNLRQLGIDPAAYRQMSLQQQVDIWLQGAGPSSQGAAFNSINSAAQSGQSIGGTKMTNGIAAACSQFGSVICRNDLASLRNGGSCSGGGIIATNQTLNNGTATLDGNGKSICSWGQEIDKKIAASGCSPSNPSNNDSNKGGCGPTGDFPTTPGTTPTTTSLIS